MRINRLLIPQDSWKQPAIECVLVVMIIVIADALWAKVLSNERIISGEFIPHKLVDPLLRRNSC